MKQKTKAPKNITVGRILVSHLLLWPIVHLILGIVTMGVWLLLGVPLQAIDLCLSCSKRSKFDTHRHEQMLDALRKGQQ